jgi:hypothetical protein
MLQRESLRIVALSLARTTRIAVLAKESTFYDDCHAELNLLVS